MFYEVGDVEKLLIELLVSHELLESNEIPIFEAALQVLINFDRVNVFDESEVFSWNTVLNTRWCYQTLI